MERASVRSTPHSAWHVDAADARSCLTTIFVVEYDPKWSAFVRNHARSVLASDFFVVVTATFRVIYVFVVLEVGATNHPLERDGASDSGVDGATVSADCPG
jgi:hypothetical protein